MTKTTPSLPSLKTLPIALLLTLATILTTPSHAQNLTAKNLRVDHLLHPDLQVTNGYPTTGDTATSSRQTLIANKQPVFAWELTSPQPAAAQTACRIILSPNPKTLENATSEHWDTGKIQTSETINILYDGPPLQPSTTYYWRVQVWDTNDKPSDWSPINHFITAPTLSTYETSHYPLLKTSEAATTLTQTTNLIQLDFARASFGQLKLNLTSHDSGETITVRLGEAIQPDGRINRAPGGTIRYAEYPITLRPGHHTYALQFTPDKRNTGPQAILMPDYIGEVLPFRYVEIENYNHPLNTTDIIRDTVHYPFNDHAAHFESSDPILNAVWDLCKYSIKATSFTGIYIDGDRERIPYEADAYINQLSHYAVDSEYTMARRSHEYLIRNATWPTEWILQSVLMAYNDYLHTGDLRSARHYYDDLKAKLLLPLREPNGLISTTTGKQTPELLKSIHFKGKALRDIVDWPHTGGFGMEGNGETDGFVFTDYNAVVNAFHYKALRDMQHLATALNRPDDANEFATKAAETHHAFQTLLWDDNAKVYRDGIDTDHASLHTNMLALTFGIVPPKHQTSVLNFIRSRGMACSVYGSQFLMDAIYDAGDAQYGLSLLTSQSDRSWYNMIRAGSTITMEAWDNKYKPNQDWNHAWGAVPANTIPHKLMGIQPITPGWKEFRVRPQIATLQHATLRLPTPRGTIHLTAQQTTNTQTYTHTVPTNTTAHFQLPINPNTTPPITINGNPAKPTTTEKWPTLPPLSSGTHTIQIQTN